MKIFTLAVLTALLALVPTGILRAQSDINLTGYTMTFDDEFNSLSLSSSSPKGSSTWYYWPPYGAAGGYSASTWTTSAFSVTSGTLSDKAYQSGSTWYSGNLSSMDPTAAGFAQQYGYFEIKAQMPSSGSGAWPAFWLMTQSSILNNNNGTTTPTEEVDILEWYGTCYDNNQPYVQEASHNWNSDGSQNSSVPYLYSPSTTMPGSALPWQAYHIYGCQVDPTHITWYIDGVQTNQISTPTTYMSGPFYMMVDYALGGGWPLTGMVNNSSLNVDWVRVYSLPTTGSSKTTVSVSLAGANTSQQLTSGSTAGASSYAATNWNVVAGASSSTATTLHDSTGSTAAGLKLSSFNSTAASTISEPSSPTADQMLFEGYVQSPYSGLPTVSLTGISYPSYNLIVYLESDSGGRTGYVSTSGSPAHYYYSTIGGSNQPSSYVQVSSTASGTYTTGNYVVFPNLTGSSQTITLNSQSNWAGICGVQVQAITTSTTAAPISLSLAGGNTTAQLASTDKAGAGSYALTNWNVIAGASSSTATALHDSNGSTSSGVKLQSFSSTSASTITEPSSPTADQKLFGGFIQSPYTGSPAITLSSIPFSKYSVVVYVESDSGGRTGYVAASGSPTSYYYSTVGGSNQPGSPSTYTQITSTASGTYTTGNYAVFTGLTGTSQTISLNGQSNWAGICGIQIIPQ